MILAPCLCGVALETGHAQGAARAAAARFAQHCQLARDLPKFAVRVDRDLLNLRLCGFEFGFTVCVQCRRPRS